MISYLDGDIRRINHMLKVYALSEAIGKSECLSPDILDTLLTAAAVHDIGIHLCEKKYASCAGKYQEIEGPAEAERLLLKLNFDSDTIERVCWLVGHHHTYLDNNESDYRILIEADFIVNADEDKLSKSAVKTAKEKIFRTHSGIKILNDMFGEL